MPTLEELTDMVAWATEEKDAAMERARLSETENKSLRRQVARLEEDLRVLRTGRPLRGRPTEAENTPVDPGPVVSSFSPPPVTPPATPQLTRANSPHDAMADLLGFPKEGR